MSNCVNFRNKEVIEIASKLGISPYMAAAKIGVWQDKNGLDKWPTWRDLNFGLKSNNLTSRLFKDSNIVTSKEALEFIANENTIFSSLAEKLLKYDKVNPVAITYKKDSTFIPSKDKDGNDIKASGVYYPFDTVDGKENEIEIANHGERREAEIILHEILHAYTYNAVRSNEGVANKLFDLLEHANKHLGNKIKKGSKEEYGLSNIDEFMVAVFTSNELVKALKEVPAHPSYKGNNFLDSFAKFILSVFNFKKTDNEFYLQAFNSVKELLEHELNKVTSLKEFENYKKAIDKANPNEPLYLPNSTNTLASPKEDVKLGVQELFNSNPELAEAVYAALGFSQLITSNDKIVFGHPGVGKTFAKKSNDFIDVDEDYKEEHAMQKILRANAKNTGKKEDLKEWEDYVTAWWNKVKTDAKKSSKQIFVSNLPILRMFPQDFDKVIDISKDTFINRAKQRNDYKQGETENWKSSLDIEIAKIDNSKVVSTDKYLSDLFITQEQKQQALQLYSQYLDQIFPNSVVKDIVYHGGDVEVFEEREEWSYFTKDKEYASNYGKVKAFKINILKGARLNTISKTEIAETYKEELKDFDGVIGEEAFGIVKKGDNSFIAKGEALVVRNPNQIHILGNKQDIKGFKDFVNKEDTILTANNKSNEVNYQLKAVNILISDKAKQVFEKGNKANWSLDKILTELQIPKGQKDIILGLGKNDREEIITDLLANYSYTIEVNVATTKEKNHLVSKIENDDYEYSYQDDEDFNRIIYENNLDTNLPYEELKQQVLNILYQKLGKEKNTPTQHYSNLTVPGGTNYTERNFETPLIKVPKSHAQFNTENTIGFTRGDDRVVYTENDIESLLATMQNSGILKIKCD